MKSVNLSSVTDVYCFHSEKMKQQVIPGSLKVDVHRVDDTTKSKYDLSKIRMVIVIMVVMISMTQSWCH